VSTGWEIGTLVQSPNQLTRTWLTFDTYMVDSWENGTCCFGEGWFEDIKVLLFLNLSC